MTVRAAAAPARPTKEAVALRAWLEQMAADPDSLPSLVDLLGARLAEGGAPLPADDVAACYEFARERQLAAIDAELQSMAAAPFPLPPAEWSRLQRIVTALRRVRDRFLDHHAESIENSGVNTRMVIPGASDDWRPVLPLARALDGQARLLRAMLWHRVDVETWDWESHARIACRLRTSSFLDVAIPDPLARGKSMTARALIVYPLLLSAAHLDRRDVAEVELIDRLARGWAGKVGLRIDEDGRWHENRHGPTLLLSDRYAIRLDAHRLDRRLQERIAVLEAAVSGSDLKLPRGLTRERCLRLLAELREDWSGAHRPRRWPNGLADKTVVRIGAPAFDVAASSAAMAATADSTGAMPASTAGGLAPAGMASRAYVYGRDEHDTIIRRAKGLDDLTRDAAVDYLQDGERATLIGRDGTDGETVVIERSALHAVKAGALVAMMTADDATAPIRLGWVTRRRQGVGRADARRTQRLMVSLWPNRVERVGIRIAANGFFEDVWLLAGVDGAPASVVTAPGRGRKDEVALLRLAQRDVLVAFGDLLQRGTGFERVEIRLPAD